jgi:poly(hydroxyalkanoate) depolymerase family esterase
MRRALFRVSLLAAVAVVAGIALTPPAQAAGSYFHGTYASVHGIRDYHGYVPSSHRPGLPLVVALHGCTENDVGFDLLTGWSEAAEREGFVVVFPDQSNIANPGGCWNWPLPVNQHRGSGEPAIIAGITSRISNEYAVDARRVYVTGVSAGGVMANTMAVTYPDVYAASSILAGCEYECDVRQARPPEQSGYAALAEMGARARPVPTVIWQGTADPFVPPSTADRIAVQWATVDRIDSTPDSVEHGQVPGGRGYTHLTYRAPGGAPLIEQYMIDGAGHSYPGGCACSLFGDPGGPDATGISWAFFVAHPMP